jgi:hypothetical protein
MASTAVRARRRSDRSDSVADDADVRPDDVDAHDDEDDKTSSTFRTRRFLSLHRRVVKSTAFFARLAATQARWLACRRLRLSSPGGSLGRPIGLERESTRQRTQRRRKRTTEALCVPPNHTDTNTHLMCTTAMCTGFFPHLSCHLQKESGENLYALANSVAYSVSTQRSIMCDFVDNLRALLDPSGNHQNDWNFQIFLISTRKKLLGLHR